MRNNSHRSLFLPMNSLSLTLCFPINSVKFWPIKKFNVEILLNAIYNINFLEK